jgi:thioredoxin reductase/ferredoxin
MESTIIWVITILVSVIIIIPSLFKYRKKKKEHVLRLKEAQELGIRRPLGQFPFIDLSKCIGCGACVAACPEGDVLGIVFGKAAIINGLRCVGHGYCADACPVQGIEIGLGNIKERDDIPYFDENFQSNVDGLYLAGEVTGISLIRNAVQHGQKVISHISERIKHEPRSEPDMYDVIIIGFGPAGLSAALTALQKGLKFLVIDSQQPGGTVYNYPRKKLVMTESVSFPGLKEIKKGEYEKEKLLQLWFYALEKYPIPLQTDEKVIDIRKHQNYFNVVTNGKEYITRFVVLAIGRRGMPRKLGVPGENQPNVFYKLTDANSFSNNKILVVGGGDSAVEAALGLSYQKGNIVYISYRKEKFFRIKQKNKQRIEEAIKKKKIIPIFNSHVKEIKKDQVELEQNGKHFTLDIDYVIVLIGGEPPFKFMKNIGIQFGGKKITELEFRA